jgi:hypothetical protein
MKTSFLSNLPYTILLIASLMLFWNVCIEPFPIIAEYTGKADADKAIELIYIKKLQPDYTYSGIKWQEFVLVWDIPTEIGQENVSIRFSKPELKALLKRDNIYSNFAQQIINMWNVK